VAWDFALTLERTPYETDEGDGGDTA